MQTMLSVVVPVYNEEESLLSFYEVLLKNLSRIGTPYEIVFVDDGSGDKTLKILKEFEAKNKAVKVYSLQKHEGKSEAMTVGFQKAIGDLIVTLDADLQDRPEEIKNLIKKQKEGYDLVSGWRKDRKDSFFKVFMSRFFNLTTRIFWGLRLHDYNSGLKLYSTHAAKSLNLYGGLHRFIPVLVFQNGFSVTEIPVAHSARKLGKSKYPKLKILTEMPDYFTILFLSKFSKRPLHFFGFIGGTMLFIGFLILVYLSIVWLGGESIGRRPLLTFGVLLFLAGIQIFFTGFVADLLINLNKEKDSSYPLKYQSK